MKNKSILYLIVIIIIVLILLLLVSNKKEGFENPKGYSQLQQDLKVLDFYKYKKGGYYIEIGANDGIELSNTYLLEKDYSWNGICIEALPDKYEDLIKNRKSININKAVYDKTGEILDFSSNNLLSGITNHIDKHTNVKNENQIKVETITLNDILEQNNAPTFIDYLSIDTEGSEYIILKAIDFTKYTFGIIHLEHNYVEPRRSDMKNLLLSNGYIYIGENQWDDEFIHNSLKN